MRGCMLLCLFALAAAQQDRNAIQYPIEAAHRDDMKTTVLFTGEPMDTLTKKSLPEANLVVGVISSPNHFEQRNAVRTTWMQLKSLTDPKLNSLSLEDKEKMVVKFVIGQVSDPKLDAKIGQENSKYHDIVRIPVAESWFNLTLKTGHFLKWADESYDFKWAFKCDDDSFVRIDRVLEELNKQPSPNDIYMGKMWTGTPVDRRVDKYTPFGEYATFAAGAGYALSANLAQFVARYYDHLEKFAMEDVAIGMWLSGLKVTYVDHPNFHSFPEGCDKHMIVQNPLNASVMKETFLNTIKNVPCHNPLPFDPSAKDIKDHVLLELGIPGSPLAPSDDIMGALEAQTMVAMPTGDDGMGMGMMGQGEEVDEEVDEEVEVEDAGMNSNHASTGMFQQMNVMPVVAAEGMGEIEGEEVAVERMNMAGKMEAYNY